MRIAMWSGPRNLSTAMMYSFANRNDFAVWDEPFYAPYLLKTGLDHPMRDEILQCHETDADAVATRCLDTIPAEKPHFYMKHMAHHMCPDFPLDWADSCVNLHLIRHPARVVASYGVKRAAPTLDDIGFPQQQALYERFGGVVVSSEQVRAAPRDTLGRLCSHLGLEFDPAMLRWPVGGHAQDGVWAAHWYGAVHKSTGFAGAEGALPRLTDAQTALVNAAMPYYEELKSQQF